MGHMASIVKDFTRARTPDILEVLMRDGPLPGVDIAGIHILARTYHQTPVATQFTAFQFAAPTRSTPLDPGTILPANAVFRSYSMHELRLCVPASSDLAPRAQCKEFCVR